MPEKNKKRFIAGAVCPRCSQMDKLVMYKQDGESFRECVSCNFKEEMRFNNTRQELQTRVNTPEESREQQIQVLTLEPRDFSKK